MKNFCYEKQNIFKTLFTVCMSLSFLEIPRKLNIGRQLTGYGHGKDVNKW